MKNVEKELTNFGDFSVEDVMVKKEMLEEVKKILGKQELLARKIFYLRFYMDASIGKIAEVLELPGATVKNVYIVL